MKYPLAISITKLKHEVQNFVILVCKKYRVTLKSDCIFWPKTGVCNIYFAEAKVGYENATGALEKTRRLAFLCICNTCTFRNSYIPPNPRR